MRFTAIDDVAAAYEVAAVAEPGPSLTELLDALVAFVRRFVVLSDSQATAWALWVAHTYAIEAARQSPYLWINSPEKESGKTLLLEVSELVVARPWLTGRVSPAVLVRKVDKERPTLLLDESDAAFRGEKEYAEALRGLLNTGHRESGKSSLCVRHGPEIDYRDFSTFCPKAIAGLGRGLPDTVISRSIPIGLKRKTQTEVVEEFDREEADEAASPLRAALASWAPAALPVLRASKPSRPNELGSRAKESAKPLLAIADLAGGHWPERARRALVELFSSGTLDADSRGVRLLRDCKTVFETRDADRLSSAGLRGALVEMEEAPWGEFNRGKELTTRGLALLLKPFDIAPGTIRLGDGTTAKGYYKAAFEDPWARYLPSPAFTNVTAAQANTDAGFLDFSDRHKLFPVTDEKRENANTDGPCDVVTDEIAQEGSRASEGNVGVMRGDPQRALFSPEEVRLLSEAMPGDLADIQATKAILEGAILTEYSRAPSSPIPPGGER